MKVETILLVLAAIMFIALTACGTVADPVSQTPTTPDTPEDILGDTDDTMLHEGAAMDNAFESIDGISLLDDYENGLLDDEAFLSSFGQVKVFYSTPFGDHKDGGVKLFAVPAPENTAYFPVFTSIERATEFFEKAGRIGFIIVGVTFTSFLEVISGLNEEGTPIEFGAIIDPGYYGITIEADSIDIALSVTQ